MGAQKQLYACDSVGEALVSRKWQECFEMSALKTKQGQVVLVIVTAFDFSEEVVEMLQILSRPVSGPVQALLEQWTQVLVKMSYSVSIEKAVQ